MTGLKAVKARLVGVVTTKAELRAAAKMSRPPDLFEIRLDHFSKIDNELQEKMSILRAPRILTARDPREGGANNLSIKQRRELLLRFLPLAAYIDIELRSAKSMRPILLRARRENVRVIISFHDFNGTTTAAQLATKARAAKRIGADIFKVAILTDTRAQLTRLFDFAANADVDLPLSVMGMGKLGRESRRELMRRRASVLHYTSIGRARLAGQPSLSETRRWALKVGR